MAATVTVRSPSQACQVALRVVAIGIGGVSDGHRVVARPLRLSDRVPRYGARPPLGGRARIGPSHSRTAHHRVTDSAAGHYFAGDTRP
eukprot:747289-Hanusia_phi.AAC.4